MKARSASRLEELRSRAHRALADERQAASEGEQRHGRLVEDLRVYQVELELQNEELRLAEAAAEGALGQYRQLFEGMPLPAVVVDRRGVFRRLNRRALPFLGLVSEEESNNRSVYRFFEADSRPLLFAEVSAPGPEGARAVTGLSVKPRRGAPFPADAHLIALDSPENGEQQTLIVFVDRREVAAQERERNLFQSILDSSTALMFAFDRNGHCVLANEAMLRTVKRSRQEVLGRLREDWLPGPDAAEHRRNDLQVIANGREQVTEEHLHNPGADERVFISQKFPLRDRDGSVLGVGGITTEVTSLRRAETRLRLAMQVFSQGSEGIVITDEANRIVSVNSAFEKMTQYAECEVIGCDPSLLSSGRHDREFYRSMWSDLLATNHWEGEIWNRRKNGEIYAEWLSISRVPDHQGNITHHVAVFSDITRRKRAEEEIERLAFFDTLTGAPNRHLLRDRISQAIRSSHRGDGGFVLMFLDLDRFKEVNDTLGHDAGDQVLVEVTRRLRSVVRDVDTVSRLGGDEFVILMPGAAQEQGMGAGQRILEALDAPFEVNRQPIGVSASIGIVLHPEDGTDPATLLKNADTAMYQAKAAGRNALRFFNADMSTRISRRAAIGNALRSAIARSEFRLAFQPQVSLSDGTVHGVEALLRWNHPSLGSPGPSDFIPVAEECGLMVAISRWVLGDSLREARRLSEAGFPGFALSVNVSASQFSQADFPEQVLGFLSESGFPGERLELEITELVAIKNPGQSRALMNRLRERGVRFALDDFGTGYSSLAYLRDLPFDTLKIDKSFLDVIGRSGRDEAMVRSVIAMARSLSLRVVAEGIETAGQMRYLRESGCDWGQGYLFGKPMSAEELVAWMAGAGGRRGGD